MFRFSKKFALRNVIKTVKGNFIYCKLRRYLIKKLFFLEYVLFLCSVDWMERSNAVFLELCMRLCTSFFDSSPKTLKNMEQ